MDNEITSILKLIQQTPTWFSGAKEIQTRIENEIQSERAKIIKILMSNIKAGRRWEGIVTGCNSPHFKDKEEVLRALLNIAPLLIQFNEDTSMKIPKGAHTMMLYLFGSWFLENKPLVEEKLGFFPKELQEKIVDFQKHVGNSEDEWKALELELKIETGEYSSTFGARRLLMGFPTTRHVYEFFFLTVLNMLSLGFAIMTFLYTKENAQLDPKTKENIRSICIAVMVIIPTFTIACLCILPTLKRQYLFPNAKFIIRPNDLYLSQFAIIATMVSSSCLIYTSNEILKTITDNKALYYVILVLSSIFLAVSVLTLFYNFYRYSKTKREKIQS